MFGLLKSKQNNYLIKESFNDNIQLHFEILEDHDPKECCNKIEETID